jgi:hypothetical protein
MAAVLPTDAIDGLVTLALRKGSVMPDSDTTLEHDAEAGELIREEPVDVTAEVIHIDDTDAIEVRPTRSIVLRQVSARQLVAGQDLSAQLVDAATDASVAVAHAPATVVDEIRSGATLPTALANTGSSVRGVVTDAGSRVRSAVGGYVGTQAALPNAVVVGAADVAESVVRAQGTVTASALNAAFSLASVATQGGDVREAFGRERTEVRATAGTARERISESVSRARQEIRAAVKDFDDLAEAFSDDD